MYIYIYITVPTMKHALRRSLPPAPVCLDSAFEIEKLSFRPHS